MQIKLRVPNFGHLALILCLMGFSIWYAWDTFSVDRDPLNLVLIIPVAALTVAVGLILVGSELTDLGQEAEELKPIRQPLTIIALLMLFILVIPYLGFDIATFVFMVVTTWALGERNLWKNVLFALLFTAGTMVMMRYATDIPPPPFLPL